MKRIAFLSVVACLIVAPALAQDSPYPIRGPAPPEHETFAKNPNPESDTLRACEEPTIGAFSDDVLALVRVLGPPSQTQVVQEIRNLGFGDLQLLIVDGFDARGGGGICIETVMPVADPPYGRIEVHYPSATTGGIGPLVLGFDGMTTGECAGFCTGCGTYCHPGYAPSVSDLIGSIYEVVYSNDERARGALEMCETYLARAPFTEDAPCEPGEGIAILRRSYPR